MSSTSSKAVIRRQKSFAAMSEILRQQMEAMLGALAELLEPDLEEGDELSSLPRCLFRRLTRLLNHLVATDDEHVTRRTRKRWLSKKVQAAIRKVRRELIGVRAWLKVVLADKPDRLMVGVPTDVPRHGPEQVLRMTEYSLSALEDPAIEIPVRETLALMFPEGFDRAAHARRLRESAEELREAHERHQEAEAELDRALVARNRALERYNFEFPEICQIFVCLFRLAGKPEFERFLLPSGQERGLLLADVRVRRAIRAGRKAAQESREPDAADPG